jgi:hypothetical protein
MEKGEKSLDMSETTKPITVGMFVVGLFLGVWALVVAVTISSATFSPPEMGADIFSGRPRVVAIPAPLRCGSEIAGAGRCDHSRPTGEGFDTAGITD